MASESSRAIAQDPESSEAPQESNGRSAARAKDTLDLVTIASLTPWLEGGVRKIGRKRLRAVLEVYSSIGGITPETLDVLLQLVSLDEIEGAKGKVSLRDSLKFLVDLDEILWRGRQDWKRAALVSMFSNGTDGVDERESEE